MNQRSFASAEFASKKKRTRRDKFLAEMERVVPWARLIAVIDPLYPTSGRVGRQPVVVVRMLRMYCLQQWYGLTDEALEDALYGQPGCSLFGDFVGIDRSGEPVPTATRATQVQAPATGQPPHQGAVRRDQRPPPIFTGEVLGFSRSFYTYRSVWIFGASTLVPRSIVVLS